MNAKKNGYTYDVSNLASIHILLKWLQKYKPNQS